MQQQKDRPHDEALQNGIVNLRNLAQLSVREIIEGLKRQQPSADAGWKNAVWKKSLVNYINTLGPAGWTVYNRSNHMGMLITSGSYPNECVRMKVQKLGEDDQSDAGSVASAPGAPLSHAGAVQQQRDGAEESAAAAVSEEKKAERAVMKYENKLQNVAELRRKEAAGETLELSQRAMINNASEFEKSLNEKIPALRQVMQKNGTPKRDIERKLAELKRVAAQPTRRPMPAAPTAPVAPALPVAPATGSGPAPVPPVTPTPVAPVAPAAPAAPASPIAPTVPASPAAPAVPAAPTPAPAPVPAPGTTAPVAALTIARCSSACPNCNGTTEFTATSIAAAQQERPLAHL